MVNAFSSNIFVCQKEEKEYEQHRRGRIITITLLQDSEFTILIPIYTALLMFLLYLFYYYNYYSS